MPDRPEPLHHVEFELGSLRFSSQGSAEVVQQQWLRFLELLQEKSVHTQVHPPDANSRSTDTTDQTTDGLTDSSHSSKLDNGRSSTAGPHGLSAAGDLEASLERVYSQNKEGLVSLRLLPSGKEREAESLVLLLYGYRALRDIKDVKSTELMKAARQSGMQLSRLDRTLAKKKPWVIEGGRGKGKVWGLNNLGVRNAEELLRAMVKGTG